LKLIGRQRKNALKPLYQYMRTFALKVPGIEKIASRCDGAAEDTMARLAHHLEVEIGTVKPAVPGDVHISSAAHLTAKIFFHINV
jgi:hypothetical protein